ncbi:hypothetical protein DWG18_13220 [Lysobacter sp. TY2-98]|nr:hypothetical protein DWG18_13220 [Lysobacter sp. TY2-98]
MPEPTHPLPAQPAPPPRKPPSAPSAADREEGQRLRNAAGHDAESGRNSARSADETRQSTD